MFDANAKELEVLEAIIVERVTEFYTNLKTSRDYRRGLSYILAQKWQKSSGTPECATLSTCYLL